MSDEEFMIEKAVRQALPLMIGLYGMSGCGKTLSALKLARGLAGPDGKIGVIDTENRRAQLYAGRPEIGEYICITLYEPFHPDRFKQAVKRLEAEGCVVIIVDSASAEWEGPGGVLDMADSEKDRTGKTGLHIWNKPKMKHKAMVQRIIRSPAHIICCCRGKHEMIQQGNNVTRGDIVPIQENGFIYEMTIHIRLPDVKTNLPELTKCMDELKPYVDVTKPISVETGAKIAEWVNKGAKVDDDLRLLLLTATDAAERGKESLKGFIASLTDMERGQLRPYQTEMNDLARSADQTTESEPDGKGGPDPERAAAAAAAFAKKEKGEDPPPEETAKTERAPGDDGKSPMFRKGHKAHGLNIGFDEYPGDPAIANSLEDWQAGWKAAEAGE